MIVEGDDYECGKWEWITDKYVEAETKTTCKSLKDADRKCNKWVTGHVTLETKHVTLRTKYVTLETKHVTLRTKHVTLRTKHVNLRTKNVTLRTINATIRTALLLSLLPLITIINPNYLPGPAKALRKKIRTQFKLTVVEPVQTLQTKLRCVCPTTAQWELALSSCRSSLLSTLCSRTLF